MDLEVQMSASERAQVSDRPKAAAVAGERR